MPTLFIFRFRTGRLTLVSMLVSILAAVIIFAPQSSALPTGSAVAAAIRNRLLDSLDSTADVITNPEFARTDGSDDASDLARNSARLHRTLFLLDTSDLLKSARLLVTGGGLRGRPEGKASPLSSLLSPSSSSSSSKTRSKRWIIKIRKPTLTFHDDAATRSHDATQGKSNDQHIN